jgi:hypothetical protein
MVLIEDDYNDDSTLITYHVKEYQEYATKYQNHYYMFCESMDPSISYWLEYIDCSRNSYLSIYIPHRMTNANAQAKP